MPPPSSSSSASAARHTPAPSAKISSTAATTASASVPPSSSAAVTGRVTRSQQSSLPISATRRHANGRFLNALRCVAIASGHAQHSLEGSIQRLYTLEAEYLPTVAGLSRLRSRASYVDAGLRSHDNDNGGCGPLANSNAPSSVSTSASSSTLLANVDALLRPRDYITQPLRPSEIGYLVSGGGASSSSSGNVMSPPSTPTAANGSGVGAAGGGSTSRVYHGWSVIGQETMIDASANNTYTSNLIADPCRTISQTYGPSFAMLDDVRTRNQLRSRVGVAADPKLAAQLELLKRGEVQAAAEMGASTPDGAGVGSSDDTSAASDIDCEMSFSHPMALIRKDV